MKKDYVKDIFYKVGDKLVMKDYWSLNNSDKVELALDEIKKYTLGKFGMLNLNEDLSLQEMFEVLNNTLKEEKEEIFICYVHYLNSIISSIQDRYSIVWWSDDETKNITLTMNNDGYYDTLKTNRNTPSYDVLCFVLDVVENRLVTEKSISKRKTLANSQNN